MAPATQRPHDRASSGRATAAQRQARELKDDDRQLPHSSSAGGKHGRAAVFLLSFSASTLAGSGARSGGKGRRNQRWPQPRRPSQRARTRHSPDQFGGLTSRPHYCLRASILGRPPSRNSRRNSFPRRRCRRRSSAARCPRYPNGSRPRQTTRRLPRANQCGSEKTDASNFAPSRSHGFYESDKEPEKVTTDEEKRNKKRKTRGVVKGEATRWSKELNTLNEPIPPHELAEGTKDDPARVLTPPRRSRKQPSCFVTET